VPHSKDQVVCNNITFKMTLYCILYFVWAVWVHITVLYVPLSVKLVVIDCGG